MRIRLDLATPGPLFEQLASSLRASIVDGRVGYGERLPAARDLASALQVNVHTVLRAYRVLRDEGLIELHPGRGATVAKRLGHHTALAGAIHDLVDEARLNGVDAPALISLIREAYR
ncbi:DNA-binding transcriptional regulator YhcF (GntR family) [Agromyces flavus]|uniref:DNA-binding transcriptional regulator YhcF (GntR family) n=1 Tax=Agromyces flavus TaxID=589382 RepID=A0A1H1R639_9MICO|nr:GntR family transcriptional regulator [Agromyces flavus]MCP2367612.1 DNA-binding transcriptional regulator YhcF (GntR family) [Agromyces flavus]GGI47045.1 GntR family transcriptional regulator [Agromyces flavus]SDS31173.1 DNA-binding transcriptional regulator YhcF, GntR family [Agromyces flavus]